MNPSVDRRILLSAENLTKKFGGLTAVNNVSFDLKQGEILGLIGPNGSGKTTLVNLLAGNLKATSGRIFFKGKLTGGIPPHRLGRMGIARTFQIVKPFRGMTVLENVSVGAMNGRSGNYSSVKKAFESAEEIVHFVGLSDDINKPADSLSVASRKRLELAKTLAMDPKLILFDEVMAGLNHIEIDSSVEIIRKIRDRGISILVIEHVMRAIKAITDRIFVLHHGEKIAEGDPAEVLTHKKVIKAYLGARYEQLTN